jgi:hypothetical protein
MTRGELIRTLRGKGLAVRPHHVQEAVSNFRLEPPPTKDGSGRLVYTQEHLRQMEDLLSGLTHGAPPPSRRDAPTTRDGGRASPPGASQTAS